MSMQLAGAVRAGDVPEVRRLLATQAGARAAINEACGEFGLPLVALAQSPEMLDALLEAGADVNARSQWWAGGFGLMDQADAELAEHALRRGATLTPHAAARLNWPERLKALLEADPRCVHARGGDGQLPLHYAATVEIAALLLEAGADMDARDVDHASTAAQYMVARRQSVARYLVQRGCATDLLMLAALGERGRAEELLEKHPEQIGMRVSAEWFPMPGPHQGGSIYQWELGWHVGVCEVAKKFGHVDLCEWLMERSPAGTRLLNACWLHEEGRVLQLAKDPELVARTAASGERQLAHAARNNDTETARLLLRAGFSARGRGQHGGTALHWAAWHGNADLTAWLLQGGADIADTDNDYKSTPLQWAKHGRENGWWREKGRYDEVEGLLEAAGPAAAQAASRPKA